MLARGPERAAGKSTTRIVRFQCHQGFRRLFQVSQSIRRVNISRKAYGHHGGRVVFDGEQVLFFVVRCFLLIELLGVQRQHVTKCHKMSQFLSRKYRGKSKKI